MNYEKEFRDPIHGFIQVSPIELEIISSPIFQRLRNIKQLSLGNYVYHGSEHSRFGHMLGAMHLAGLAFDSLKRNSIKLNETLDVDDSDRQSLRIAALLHDVGHSPFSHSLENLLNAKHEKYSTALVEHHFGPILEKAGLKIETIQNLILGDPYPDKPYLSHIVNGQLDVDRLDYLLRDSYFTGVSYGKYDLNRLIDQFAVVEKKIVVLQGGYETVEQFIFARYQMYQQVYFHKTKRSFELMLWKAGDILKNSNNIEYPTITDLETEKGQKQYVDCDDRWFLNRIYDENNPEEVKILAKMIKSRIPYQETYSPLTFREKSDYVKSQPYDDTVGLDVIEKFLLKKLPKLNIQDHEFLTDDLSRAPYSLMPNYGTTDEIDAEGDTIQIFYKNRKVIEPIENRSNVVYTFGTYRPSMKRGFVIPEKYDIIKQTLKDNFDYPLPERNSKL